MQDNFNYKNIDTWKDRYGGVIFAVVEITKGTVVKNELDCQKDMIIPVRAIHKKYKYIFNYGFISKTYADDNDPMDVAVICKEKLLPKSVLPCRVVGVIKTVDNGEQDDKIIAVPIYQSGGKEQTKNSGKEAQNGKVRTNHIHRRNGVAFNCRYRNVLY